jgi:hypothetical protein
MNMHHQFQGYEISSIDLDLDAQLATKGPLQIHLIARAPDCPLARPALDRIEEVRASGGRLEILFTRTPNGRPGWRAGADNCVDARFADFRSADQLVGQLIAGDSVWTLAQDGALVGHLSCSPAAIALAKQSFRFVFALARPMVAHRIAA